MTQPDTPKTRLSFRCRCGTSHWHVDVPKSGTRVLCYCADCQTAARHLDADVLNEGGGTDILQVAAHQVHFDGPPPSLMRLSPKGLFRWHCSCCNTPIANTLPFPHLSFAGVLLANAVAETEHGPAGVALPKTAAVVNSIYAQGRPGVPKKDRGLGRAVLAMFKRALAARLSGKWRDTPFFKGPPWKPVAEPQVISKEARNAARP